MTIRDSPVQAYDGSILQLVARKRAYGKTDPQIIGCREPRAHGFRQRGFCGKIDALLGDWDLNIAKTTTFDGKPISIIDYPIADTVTDTDQARDYTESCTA